MISRVTVAFENLIKKAFFATTDLSLHAIQVNNIHRLIGMDSTKINKFSPVSIVCGVLVVSFLSFFV